MGPIGSGKSVGCCLDLAKWASEIPKDRTGVRRSRFVIVRNTYRELIDTTMATWLKWFPETQWGPVLKNEMSHTLKTKGLEATFLFRAADKPDDLGKFLSLELTGGWLNEARELGLGVMQTLEGRTSRFPSHDDVPVYRSGLIMDTNPPDTDHWWFKFAEILVPKIRDLEETGERDPRTACAELNDLLQELRLGEIPASVMLDARKAERMWHVLKAKYEFFRQPSGLSDEAENMAHLDPDYYIRQMIGKSAEWINVYVKGEYGLAIDGKPVFPEYRDDFHYNERLLRPIKGLKIMRGWDFGRTPACVFTQLDHRGRWLVFDEMCSTDMAIDEFAPLVVKHCEVEYPGYNFVDYCDPSGFFKGDKDDRTCAEILAGHGVDVSASMGGTQNTRLRIESISKALRGGLIDGRPEFQVGPKAVTVRKGLMGGYNYKRMQVSGERYKDEPDKNECSHPMDALQYIGVNLYRARLFDPNSGAELEPEGEPHLYEPVTHSLGRSAVCGY